MTGSVAATRHLDCVPTDTEVVRVDEEPSIDETGDLAAELDEYMSGLSTLNHAFEIPQGTYTWNTQLEEIDGEFLGIIGDGTATFKVRKQIDWAMQPGVYTSLSEICLRNFTVDIDGTTSGRGPDEEVDIGLLRARPGGGLIENVHLTGQRYRYQNGPETPVGPRHTFLVEVFDPNGELRGVEVELSTERRVDDASERHPAVVDVERDEPLVVSLVEIGWASRIVSGKSDRRAPENDESASSWRTSHRNMLAAATPRYANKPNPASRIRGSVPH